MTNLFNNPGYKIKRLATVFFWIGVALSVVLAGFFGWSKVSSYNYYYGMMTSSTVFNPFVFFAILVLGPLCSYIDSLLLYAFGELVENSDNKRSKCGCRHKHHAEDINPDDLRIQEEIGTDDAPYAKVQETEAKKIEASDEPTEPEEDN